MTHRYVARLAMWVRHYCEIEFTHESASPEVAAQEVLTRDFILENLPEVDNEDYSHSNPIGIFVPSVYVVDGNDENIEDQEVELEIEDNINDAWFTTFNAYEVEEMIKIASGLPPGQYGDALRKRLDTFSVQIATYRIRKGL